MMYYEEPREPCMRDLHVDLEVVLTYCLDTYYDTSHFHIQGAAQKLLKLLSRFFDAAPRITTFALNLRKVLENLFGVS